MRQGNSADFKASKINLPDLVGLGYLAGLLDGEGNINNQSRKGEPRWRIVIGMTDANTIAWLRKIGGGYRLRSPQKETWLPLHCWQVLKQREVLAILEAVQPYLITKRAKAAEAILDIRRELAKQPELTLIAYDPATGVGN